MGNAYLLEYYTDTKETAKKAFEYVTRFYGEYLYNYKEHYRVKQGMNVIKCEFSFIVNNDNYVEAIRKDVQNALSDIVYQFTIEN